AVAEQEAEAVVGFFGGAEAGVLAHRPEAAAVHVRLHAARVRKLAGHAELGRILRAVRRPVERLDGNAREGFEFLTPFGGFRERGREHLRVPAGELLIETGHEMYLSSFPTRSGPAAARPKLRSLPPPRPL